MTIGEKILQCLTYAFSSLTFSNPENFGSPPDESYRPRFIQSPQFDAEEGIFVNRKKEAIKEMRKRSMNASILLEAMREGDQRIPGRLLPSVKPDFARFSAATDSIRVVWFGHSSFLVNIEGTLILIDPVFSGNASPFRFATKRFQAPPVTLEELPPIPFIIISHDHYDHLDRETVEFFARKDTRFIAPLGVSSHLKSWGVDPSRIQELDWWETAQAGPLQVTAAPAQHFSGRSLTDNAKTLWASWVIKGPRTSIFYSGDSGYDRHFQEIGERLGPFDLALMENGQYNEAWHEVHLLPHEVVKAFHEVKAKRLLPAHWGMFKLAFHSWSEPMEKVFEASEKEGFPLLTPKLGEVLDLEEDNHPNPWWREAPSP